MPFDVQRALKTVLGTHHIRGGQLWRGFALEGMSYHTVQAKLRGENRGAELRVLVAICRVFGVTLEELLRAGGMTEEELTPLFKSGDKDGSKNPDQNRQLRLGLEAHEWRKTA